MIEIKNFTKSFGERKIFESLNVTFPSKGIISILGPSGSGKSTLLNCISGVDKNYDGTIRINGVDISSLSDCELRDFRIKKIGYVFQNFNLLNLETSEENVALPLDSCSNAKKIIRKQRIRDLFFRLKISKLKKKNVNKCSGGEKQRIALARAIANEPEVVLCDEPTGALDEKNSEQIFDILRGFAVKSLVLVVTHDKENAMRFSDIVYLLKDENLLMIQKKNDKKQNDLFAISANKKMNKSRMSFLFKITHCFHKIKTKKYRSIMVNSILSISLVGIGISLMLSTSVSNGIQSAFSNIIKGNQIIMSLKNENQPTFGSVYTAPLNKAKDIQNRYPDYIKGIGVNYLVNFEDFFKDSNRFYVSSTPYKIDVPSLSARSINDFVFIDKKEDLICYPYTPKELNDDEIILGLNYVDMVNLCYKLQIQRSYSSLGNYLAEKGLTISLEVENGDWEYYDEQIFDVVGVIETSNSIFYHYDLLWNQHIYEDQMRFPFDDDKKTELPWEMFRIYYLETKDNPSAFLNLALYDDSLYDFVFEKTSFDYNPLLCQTNEICNINRLYVYFVDRHSINTSYVPTILKNFPEIDGYYFGSEYGYSSYASGMLNGFSKKLFLSLDEDKNDAVIDAESSNFNMSQLTLPDGVIEGYYLNSVSGGIEFSSVYPILQYGRKPKNNNEILISSGLGKKLMDDNLGLGKYLYLSAVQSEELDINGNIDKKYKTVKVVVTGIVENENPIIYQNNDWTISFFRDNIGISSFNLIPNKVIFELGSEINPKSVVDKLKLLFSEYDFTSPKYELSNSVEETMRYARLLLICFSALALVISSLLMGTIILINLTESKNEIELLRYLGIRNGDIKSMFLIESLIQSFCAFLISTIELLVFGIALRLPLLGNAQMPFSLSISPSVILILLLISICLPILITFPILSAKLKEIK